MMTFALTSASPFKDPRSAPPCMPRHTAKLWDEYEKKAIENVKRRESAHSGHVSIQAPQSQRFSSGTVLDIIKSYDPHASPGLTTASGSPRFDFGFSTLLHDNAGSGSASNTTVAICKTCKQSVTSASGICERCNRIIVLPSSYGESTPSLSPSCQIIASTDIPKLSEEPTSEPLSPTSLPKRISQQSTSFQLLDPPIRRSSLKPPPGHEVDSPPSDPTQSRKGSLADPKEPPFRLHIPRKPLPRAHPASPITPPSTSHSQTSTPHTRPSSLANITTPPQYANYSRKTSATPSELSTLYPYVSNPTTPLSVCRSSYQLQNTTSAWDDWESDEEKAGLVAYWRSKKWKGSRSNLGNSGSGRRESAGKDESVKEEGRKKRRGFVRVISCGCRESE